MSVAKQKVLPTEVVIADDGSGQLTRDLIADFQRDFPVPIKHIWHPDDGFKLSEIRNKGIAASTGDYIIQVDGDLILHPHFIADHINFSRPNTFVTGSRVMLDKALSEELIKNECVTINYFTKGLQNRSNGLRSRFLRDHIMAGYRRNDIYFMRGCNMAFWKQDLLRVNGYNEEFTGWGREDNELAARLINAGLLKRVIKFSAVVYHLYHEQNFKRRFKSK